MYSIVSCANYIRDPHLAEHFLNAGLDRQLEDRVYIGRLRALLGFRYARLPHEVHMTSLHTIVSIEACATIKRLLASRNSKKSQSTSSD